MIKKIIKLVVILAVSFTAFSCTAQAIKNKDVNTAQAADIVAVDNYTQYFNFETPLQIADFNSHSIFDYLLSVTISSNNRVTIRMIGVKADGTTLVRNTLFNNTMFFGQYPNIDQVYSDTFDTIPQDGTFLSTNGNLGFFCGGIEAENDDNFIKPAEVQIIHYTTRTIDNIKFAVIEMYRNEEDSEDETNVDKWVIGIQIPNATQYFYIGYNRLKYNDGLEVGRNEGYDEGYNEGYDEGEDVGYAEGLGDGYEEGFNDGSLNMNTAQAFWVGAQNFLTTMGNTIANLFGQEIIPTSGIAIGHIVIGVPLLFGALGLIFKFFGGKKE